MVMHRCEVCYEPRNLLARVRGKLVCGVCWNKAGQPSPLPSDAKERHEAEVRNLEAMTRRGGADAYRVKAGKA